MAQERIPLTAVIVDDGGYGMLRYDQQLAGAERYGVDLRTPDFEAVARAFGVHAQTVEGLDDAFGAALADHVADQRPSVLVARTPEPLVPPPNTSPNWYRRRR
jgi:acetolactate synthase-1/2/3 large subunit